MRMFLSDLHIGEIGSQYKKAIQAIKNENPDELYLVGDIFDLWVTSFEKILETNFDFLNFLCYEARNVHFILGNHDDEINRHLTCFENITFLQSKVLDINNKKIRIIHGHEYDDFVKDFGIVAKTISRIHEWVMKILRIDLKFLRFSFASYHNKSYFSKMLGVVKDKAIADSVDCDVLIMGHTHIPEIEKINNFEYINLGDWVKHTTYVIEQNGQFTLKIY